jgi:hypothetical protein
MPDILEVTESWGGFKPAHRRGQPESWDAQIEECVRLVDNAEGYDSATWAYRIQEAMTTSNFSGLFGDALEREVRARYTTAQPNVAQVSKRRDLRDFREAKSWLYTGIQGRLQQVEEKGEYLARTLTEAETTWAVKKWGDQVDFSWEAFINDDLGALADVAQRMADSAVNTNEYFLTSLCWAAAGPITATFADATATTVLTIANLETAVEAMSSRTQTDPNTGAIPLMARPKYLMVPPALEFTALQILNSPIKQWTYGGDDEAAAVPYPTTNVISQYGLVLIVNPWIPLLDTTTGTTTWALFTDPRDIPTLEHGHLKGHEAPEIWMKAPDAVRVGGGTVGQFDGDFATDNIFYRTRHTLGGTSLDPNGGWVSSGSG